MALRSSNGLKHWLLQRITAVYLAGYVVFMWAALARLGSLDYASWRALFTGWNQQVTFLLALSAVLVHAWLGLWTVCTDYLKSRVLRLGVQSVVMGTLVGFLFWGMRLLLPLQGYG